MREVHVAVGRRGIRSRCGRDSGLRLGRQLGGFGAAAGAADVLACLGCVVGRILFHGVGGASGMLTSQVFDLVCLGIHNVGSVCNLVVNDFLVGDVDEGSQVQNRGTDQGETPKRNNLDQPIRY